MKFTLFTRGRLNGIGPRHMLFLAAAALFLCFPTAGSHGRFAGLSLVSAATAQYAPERAAYNWDNGIEPEETPAMRFLKAHGKAFFGGMVIVMLVVCMITMGPSSLAELLKPAPARRYGGFGRNGGFGGSISDMSDLFKSN